MSVDITVMMDYTSSEVHTVLFDHRICGCDSWNDLPVDLVALLGRPITGDIGAVKYPLVRYDAIKVALAS